LKIIDFGLAQTMFEIRPESRAGTPAFMPPERANTQCDLIGPHSDVFGIGAVFYFLLTGRPPFNGTCEKSAIAQSQSGQIPAPRDIAKGVPRGYQRLCMACLDLNIANRIPSIESVRREIAILKENEETHRRWIRLAFASVILAIGCVIICLIYT
jgi:serine/threonine-protein kinase